MDVVVTALHRLDEIQRLMKHAGYKWRGLCHAYLTEHHLIDQHTYQVNIYDCSLSTICLLNRMTGGIVEFKEKLKDIHRCDATLYLDAMQMIQLSRKFLCNNTNMYIKNLWEQVKEFTAEADPSLAGYMQPDCVYRGGYCFKLEESCCEYPGAMPQYWKTLTKTNKENA